jgi:hypothetical protein
VSIGCSNPFLRMFVVHDSDEQATIVSRPDRKPDMMDLIKLMACILRRQRVGFGHEVELPGSRAVMCSSYAP